MLMGILKSIAEKAFEARAREATGEGGAGGERDGGERDEESRCFIFDHSMGRRQSLNLTALLYFHFDGEETQQGCGGQGRAWCGSRRACAG